ncbi:hypothetical protein SAMN04489718_3542 [Actinopolyspora saharensis]|uniref:Uncharacterized protein n=1 Tax=Actinopolyspora saharensis TaxID=995062 RepID=A0A1H1GBV3_9ACTN|nr:hypothetical protein SAMN04489718_3542 [Actinopolyspora saharensis]
MWSLLNSAKFGSALTRSAPTHSPIPSESCTVRSPRRTVPAGPGSPRLLRPAQRNPRAGRLELVTPPLSRAVPRRVRQGPASFERPHWRVAERSADSSPGYHQPARAQTYRRNAGPAVRNRPPGSDTPPRPEQPPESSGQELPTKGSAPTKALTSLSSRHHCRFSCRMRGTFRAKLRSPRSRGVSTRCRASAAKRRERFRPEPATTSRSPKSLSPQRERFEPDPSAPPRVLSWCSREDGPDVV